MKTRTLLIAAVMLVTLSAAAFGQAIYAVSSTPVTAVIATGNAELAGNITFTNTSGVGTLSGTISIQYGGTNVNITSPWTSIFACVPNAIATTPSAAGCPTGTGTYTGLQVDTTASIYSPGLLVIDVPAAMPATSSITIAGVRVQINGSGLTNLVASISATNNLIQSGGTTPTVINSTTGAGIASGGVVSYLNAPALLTSAVAGAPVLSSTSGLMTSGTATTTYTTTTTTIRVQEGFGAAFTKGVGVRITVSPRPPAGLTFAFPMAATSYDSTGTVTVNPNWVLGSSASTTAATANQTISSSTSSSLAAYYYVGTDTTNDAVYSEYLEIPVTLTTSFATSQLPVTAANYTYTVSLAPIQNPYNSSGVPGTLLAPRFAALESTAANLLTMTGGAGQTVLLLPYVSTQSGFDTGIAIANTTTDPGSTALGFGGAVVQTGPITFYFYPVGGSVISIATTALTNPTAWGLNSAGSLATGQTFVGMASNLLIAAGQTTTAAHAFSGYVFAVTGFGDAAGIYCTSNWTNLSAYSAVMQVITAR